MWNMNEWEDFITVYLGMHRNKNIGSVDIYIW